MHRNAQYGLVPFRVLKLKIEDEDINPNPLTVDIGASFRDIYINMANNVHEQPC